MSLAANPDVPMSLAANPDASMSLAANPDVPMSLAANPDATIHAAANPDIPVIVGFMCLRSRSGVRVGLRRTVGGFEVVDDVVGLVHLDVGVGVDEVGDHHLAAAVDEFGAAGAVFADVFDVVVEV